MSSSYLKLARLGLAMMWFVMSSMLGLSLGKFECLTQGEGGYYISITPLVLQILCWSNTIRKVIVDIKVCKRNIYHLPPPPPPTPQSTIICHTPYLENVYRRRDHCTNCETVAVILPHLLSIYYYAIYSMSGSFHRWRKVF